MPFVSRERQKPADRLAQTARRGKRGEGCNAEPVEPRGARAGAWGSANTSSGRSTAVCVWGFPRACNAGPRPALDGRTRQPPSATRFETSFVPFASFVSRAAAFAPGAGGAVRDTRSTARQSQSALARLLPLDLIAPDGYCDRHAHSPTTRPGLRHRGRAGCVDLGPDPRHAGAGGRRHGRGPRQPARSRQVQSHDQGTHRIRRSAPGHETQPRRRGLDRSAVEDLRLHQHRAHQVRLHRSGAQPGGRARPWRGRPRTGCRHSARRAQAPRPGREHDLRQHGADRRQHRPDGPARRDAALARLRTGSRRAARRGLLYENRRHSP